MSAETISRDGTNFSPNTKEFLESGITKIRQTTHQESSSLVLSPRRSRRSLATPSKPPMETLVEDAPLTQTNSGPVEVYDLSSLENVQKCADTPRKEASLRKFLLSKHLNEDVAASENTDSGLSEEDIKQQTSRRSARRRTISQTSGLSAMSEESVSSHTRSKTKLQNGDASAQVEASPLPSPKPRSSRRRSMPASGLGAADSGAAASPGRATRRRTLQAADFTTQDSASPKKQKASIDQFNVERSFDFICARSDVSPSSVGGKNHEATTLLRA